MPHRALLPLYLDTTGVDLVHYFSEKRRLGALRADDPAKLESSLGWAVYDFSSNPSNARALFLARMSKRDGVAWCPTEREHGRAESVSRAFALKAAQDRNTALFDLCVRLYPEGLSSNRPIKVALRTGDVEWVAKFLTYEPRIMACWLKRLAQEPLSRPGEWTGSDSEVFRQEEPRITSTILSKHRDAVALYRKHLRPVPTGGFGQED